MKRLAVVSLAFLILTAPLSGCHGPQKLSRSLDEWVNERYIESPFFVGNTLSHLLLIAATTLTWTVDSFINMYYFWVDDAKPFGSGKGTAYPFRAVTPTKK
jgi:hypothetical protein